MATTPNYGFNLPNLNADEGVWGEKLNQNWSSVDQIIFDLTPASGGVEEAPEDGQPYVREDADWVLGVTSAYSEATYSKIGHTHNHAALTGVTADQHHNQVHLLYGPDQSDVDTLVTPLVRHVLGVNGAGDFAPDYRAGWRGT
jgi:hypothetical protein